MSIKIIITTQIRHNGKNIYKTQWAFASSSDKTKVSNRFGISGAWEIMENILREFLTLLAVDRQDIIHSGAVNVLGFQH